MIKITNVNKQYPLKKDEVFDALIDINLQLDDNLAYGIIGQSGAGKSTLIRMLNGLIKPTSGIIEVDGVDIGTLKDKELNQLRFQMGMVFQNFNLLSQYTVYQNIKIALDVAKYPKKMKEARILEVLELVKLSDKKNSYPAELSGGQRQRVGIARAIANKPKYLLCDEVTSALDHNTAIDIITVLNEIKVQTNMTIIFITHQIEMARKLCDQMIVMSEGKIVEINETKQLFIKPEATATKELIDAVLELPKIKTAGVYRLVYANQMIAETNLSDVIKKYQITANIIYAKTIDIKDEQLGYLIIQITGEKQAAAIAELKKMGVDVSLCQ